MTYVILSIYFLFVHFTLLIPGYAFVRSTKLFSSNRGLELSSAYAITILVSGTLVILGYSLGLSWDLLRAVGWALMLLGLIYFIRQRLWRDIWLQRLPLLCLVLLSIMSIAFISLHFSKEPRFIPDPQPMESSDYKSFDVKILNISQTVANDNSIPYRQAQFFINRSNPAKDSFIDEWGVHFFQRTPLMGAVTANYFNLLNERPPRDYIWKKISVDPHHTYIQFQILAIILNSLFVLPAFYLIARLFNRKTAAVSALFFVVSPFFIYNGFFSWPKSLAAFFTLLMWLLLLENRFKYTVLAGVAAGLAYLSHDLAVLYIGASSVFLLLNKRWKDLIVLGGISAIFAAPWLFISAIIFKKPSTFIYYPFSTEGIPQISERRAVIRTFLHTPLVNIFKVRFDNLFYLLSPYQLLTSEGNQDIGRRLWALSLFSIPGALGIGLLAPVYLALIKGFRKVSFWIFVLTPVILSVVIIGWPKGLGALHFAEPVVALLVGLSVAYLVCLKRNAWLILAYSLNVAQLIYFLIYSYGFATSPWLRRPEDLAALLTMVAIVAFCGFFIYILSSGSKGPSPFLESAKKILD